MPRFGSDSLLALHTLRTRLPPNDVIFAAVNDIDLGSIPRSSLMYQLEQSFLHAAGENFAAVFYARPPLSVSGGGSTCLLASIGRFTYSLFVCPYCSRSLIAHS